MDRRQRRRQETIEEILRTAVTVMAEEGVAALSLSEVARRVGIQPPSLYKYFPSRLAVYDALFRSGYGRLLQTLRLAVRATEPGLPALAAGVEAIGRFGMDNQVIAQLMSWRPVPGFTPSADAFAPSLALVEEIGQILEAAVARGQLHPDAATADGLRVLSMLITGAMTQQLANQPAASFTDGEFTRLLPRLLDMFVQTYPPRTRPTEESGS